MKGHEKTKRGTEKEGGRNGRIRREVEWERATPKGEGYKGKKGEKKGGGWGGRRGKEVAGNKERKGKKGREENEKFAGKI